jgi:hypothetical protein
MLRSERGMETSVPGRRGPPRDAPAGDEDVIVIVWEVRSLVVRPRVDIIGPPGGGGV